MKEKLLKKMENLKSKKLTDKNYGILKNIRSLIKGEAIFIDSAIEEDYNNCSDYNEHSFFLLIKNKKFIIKQIISQIDYNPSQGGKKEDDYEERTEITDGQGFYLLFDRKDDLVDGESYYEPMDLFLQYKA